MTEREEGIERLHPRFFNSRKYYLIQLRKQIEFVIDNHIHKNKQAVVADYGCGNKPYEQLFTPFIEKYIGIDLPENSRADVHILPDGKIQLEDNSVDVVVSTQVLEHVGNPGHYLTEALRILKPKGILILSTHGYWMYHQDPADYWRWTSSGLKKIISERSFTIEYFRGIIGRAAVGLQLFQDGLLFKLPKFIIRPVFALIMQMFIALFDKMSSQASKDSDACTFVVVARKN